MANVNQNTDTELKEELILLIVYYVIIIVAMVCTILCTCRRKKHKPLLCCRSKENRFFNSDYIQCIRLIPFAGFQTNENNLHSISEVENETGNHSNSVARPSIYHVELACYENYRKNTWKPYYKQSKRFKIYQKRNKSVLKLEVIREVLQEEYNEAGKA